MIIYFIVLYYLYEVDTSFQFGNNGSLV